MIRNTITTTVERSPERVFAFLSDYDNLPRYEPWVESVERTSAGPIGVGSTWTHTRRQGGRRITAPIEIVEFEPNRLVTIASDAGSIKVRSMTVCEPAGTGTRVTETLEMRTSGILRLAEPFIGRSAATQAQEVHQRFKALLESEPA